MKRNPTYSRLSQWIFPIIVNGLVINKKAVDTVYDGDGNPFAPGYGKIDMYGDVIMHGAFKSWDNARNDFKETKQEKFNRVFQVEDAKIIN